MFFLRAISPRLRVTGKLQPAVRSLVISHVLHDSGAALTRSKEVGAQEETEDITEMDELLSISRTSDRPSTLSPLRQLRRTGQSQVSEVSRQHADTGTLGG